MMNRCPTLRHTLRPFHTAVPLPWPFLGTWQRCSSQSRSSWHLSTPGWGAGQYRSKPDVAFVALQARRHPLSIRGCRASQVQGDSR